MENSDLLSQIIPNLNTRRVLYSTKNSKETLFPTVVHQVGNPIIIYQLVTLLMNRILTETLLTSSLGCKAND